MTVSASVAFQMQFSGSAGAWQDVTSDVRRQVPARVVYGIQGDGPRDRLAQTGTMSFGLDNSEGNSVKKLGYYATDHASARSGFDLGIGARLSITYAGSTFYKFVGKLDAAEPLPGKRGDRYTTCTATDWFEEAAKYKLRLLDVQTNKRADENIVTVINSMTNKPSASSLAAGQDIFPTSLDTAKDETTTAYSEISKNVMSELGYGYISGAVATGPLLSSVSPTAYWRMDEASGSRASMVGGYTLTERTGSTFGVVGLRDTAACFTRSASNCLSITASQLMPTQYQSFAVNCWAKPTTTEAVNRIFRCGSALAGAANYMWILDYAAASQFIVHLSNGIAYASASVVTAGASGIWHHVVAWYDTAASAVYLQVNNGTTASAAAASGVNQGITSPSLWAGANPGLQNYAGLLDEAFIVVGDTLDATERAALYNSGYGLTYEQAFVENSPGGLLTFEDRHTRPKTTTVSASLSDTMIGMAPKRERGGIYNRVKVTTHPRELSSGSVILYSLQSKPLVQPGASLILSGMYTDPDQRGVARVGGASMIAPVSPCDYQMNGASDGTGACLDGGFTVSPSYGGNTVQYSVYNGGTVPAYVTRLQARGVGIYDREPTVSEKTDTSSIAAYGEAVLELDLPYQGSVLVGDDAANYLLSTQKVPTTRLPQVEFIGNKSDELMRAGLQTEPGDRVKIIETATGLNKEYFVNGCEIDLPADGTIHFVWTLAPADMTQYWILGITGQSELDTTARPGY